MPPPTRDTGQRTRRIPQQTRSRDRVERILDATAHLVVDQGMDALSTRSIAERAEIPVASLYQYFADKEAILLALVTRDLEEMDAQVAADLGEMRMLSVSSIVATTMRAFTKVHRRRPAFVMIWLRGRTSPEIRAFGRDHNRRVARDLFDLGSRAGLLRSECTPLHAELAVEVGDRLFQLAFENDLSGDDTILEEAIDLVTTSMLRFATPLGRDGIAL